MRRWIAATALGLALPLAVSGQEVDRPYHGQGYFIFAAAPARVSFATGGSAPVSLQSNANAHQLGGGGEFLAGAGVGFGGELFNSTQLWQGASLNTWIGSIDVSYHFGSSRKKRRVEPFVTGGYTFYYVANIDLVHENGGNFGGGVNVWLLHRTALRLEIRDDIGGQDLSAEFEPEGTYFLRSSRHLVGFRLGMTFR